MASPNAAKPATAPHGEPASNVEQPAKKLKLDNKPSSFSQSETALAAAFREAARRKVVAQ
jgi:hypothetical protein